MNGPDGDFELLRELGGGQAATALEQEQQVDQATGAHLGSIRLNPTGSVMYIRTIASV
jgi:hypothetical protein